MGSLWASNRASSTAIVRMDRWDPAHGHRFNYNKLLVDPYAKAISGQVDWKQPIFPFDVSSGDDLKIDHQDSATGIPQMRGDRKQI